MKILFLAKCLNASGVTTQMLTLGNSYLNQGHDVMILSGGVTIESKEKIQGLLNESKIIFKENSFPTERKSLLLEAFSYFFTIPETLYLIRKFKPDIIHIHWPVTTYVAKMYQKIFKVPIVQTFHIGSPQKSFLHRKADAAIAISSELESDIMRVFSYKKEEIWKIYNGVIKEDFQPRKNLAIKKKLELGIKEDEVVLSYIGSLETRKGLDILFEALSKVKTDYKIKTLIIGDGDNQWVNELIQKYNLHNIVMSFSFQSPYDFYNISDIFILPSRKEGFPTVILEAMLMEVAVVRSNVEGAYDQIDNLIDGVIFESENSDELAGRLLQLIEDGQLRKKMAVNGRAKAEQLFTSEIMCKKTLNLYEELIKMKKN